MLSQGFSSKILLVASFFLLAFAVPEGLFAQVSVNVPLTDPVYRDIDKLVANGLVDIIIVGQRPYSRKEIARIAKEAMAHLVRLEKPVNDPSTSAKKKAKLQKRIDYIQPILARLKVNYREELVQLGALPGKKSWYSLHPLEKVEVDVTILDSPSEPLPLNNGLGEINARINPLVNYRQGRRLIDGSNLALETTTWLRASNYFAALVKPRFQLAFGRNGATDENRIDLLNLYGKIYFHNFEIEVGRDNLFWGQGYNSGLPLSNNPRGLDFAKASNDSPFFFPWVFRYIGANKFSFFYADLGPEQNFPNAYLAGWKWSFQPVSFIEIGAAFLAQAGGEGSPPASFGERVEDVLLPLAQGAFTEISNRLGGFDARFRIPPLRGTEIYLEGLWDDGGPISKRVFWQDVGYVFGLYIPRLTESGNLDLRIEYQHTGVRYYRHNQWTSGWTLNQHLIGSNLGPNAYGVTAILNWDVNFENMLKFSFNFENRSSDIWGVNGSTDADGNFNIEGNFFKVQDNPEEIRGRFVTEWLYRFPQDRMLLRVAAGYERVHNFNFVSGNDRNNFLGRVNLQVDLDSWTRFPK